MSDKSMNGFKRFIERTKTFFCSRAGEIVLLTLTSLLALMFTALLYSTKLTEIPGYTTGRDKLSLWTADMFYTQTMRIRDMNMYLSVAFAVGGVLFLVALLFMLLKKKRTLFYFAATFNAGLNVVCVIIGIALKMMRTGAIILGIVGALVDVITLAYLIARRRTALAAKQDEEDPQQLTKNQKIYKRVLLICECVALAILTTVLFIPVYAESGSGMSYVLIKSVGANNYPVYVSIGFIAMIIALFVEMLFFISTISDYFGAKTFAIRARHFVLSTTVFTLIFFLLGYSLAFYYNLSGTAAAASRQADTVCYIPFVLSVVNMIVFAVFSGKIPVAAGGHILPRKTLRVEPLLAVLVITIITFAALAVNIIEIHVKVPIAGVDRHVAFTGYELLTTYKKLDSGFQMLAFIEFAFLLMSGILFVLSLMSYVGKDKSYYKLIRVSAIANLFFVLLIGLFGVYFKIGQKINVESIESVLTFYGVTLPDVYEYEVTSQTIYMLFASVVVIVYMILRKMFSLGVIQAEPVQGDIGGAGVSAEAHSSAHTVDDNGMLVPVDFDACPAFTEIDHLQDKFKIALEKRRKQLFENLTLPNLIRFLVDYARESRLHLSYTPEDMATFVAGLGASRLTILQGMSGTGKTSLPKIFTEALMSNCEIVEVESSWRDKNELLGYYNEFSKCYTPKKFTQCLYRARLNSEVITLIVLDEMNLSRIEYYFSDFLSLMENEENRRAIKLLNVKLSRTENGHKIEYDGLKDGHTIKIPTNIWFIGTANRDESTFEISDKVYDRAQTMNFNKRAPKVASFSEPLDPRFISYDMLLKLFDEAKESYEFDAESNKLIMGAEKLLAPYNISFGNRILRQMEAFIKIYCACFGDQAAVENSAVEKILLSKVVRKLENKVVENKESLAKEFDKLGLMECSAFVRNLNED